MSQALVNATGADKLPSGTWSIGPVTIAWSLKSPTDIDVEVDVFGIDIDNLDGTLSETSGKLFNHISVLGIVTGDFGVEAKYGQGAAIDGLYVEGRLTGPGFDTGDLDVRIVPW